MGSFTLDLTRFKQKTEQQMSQKVRDIVLDLYSRIVVRSPVDTGRYRANHSISLHSLPAGAVIEFEAGGTVSVHDKGQVLAAYKLGDTIFLFNNVEYALALEYGHSQQAPQGVYRISVQDIVSHFGGAA